MNSTMEPSFKVVFQNEKKKKKKKKKGTCGSREQYMGPIKTTGHAKNAGGGCYPNGYQVVPRITTNI